VNQKLEDSRVGTVSITRNAGNEAVLSIGADFSPAGVGAVGST